MRFDSGEDFQKFENLRLVHIQYISCLQGNSILKPQKKTPTKNNVYLAITFSKLTIDTLKQGVNCAQSSQ